MLPLAVEHRGYGDEHAHHAAVLVQTLGSELAEALAARDLGEDLVLFLLALDRDQLADRLADHFLGGIAEQPLALPGSSSLRTELRSFATIASSEDCTNAA